MLGLVFVDLSHQVVLSRAEQLWRFKYFTAYSSYDISFTALEVTTVQADIEQNMKIMHAHIY